MYIIEIAIRLYFGVTTNTLRQVLEEVNIILSNNEINDSHTIFQHKYSITYSLQVRESRADTIAQPCKTKNHIIDRILILKQFFGCHSLIKSMTSRFKNVDTNLLKCASI